jgi:hypothetical protein
MPGKRIPDLPAIAGASTANDDNLVIFDTDASTTKRILRSQLAAGLVGDLPYTPSGGISATTVPTAIAELDTEKVAFTRLDDSDGSNLVGFLQSGTGAAATTVQAKLRQIEVNLADFGTVGDSVNGDDATWQKALNYLSTLPGGTPGVQGVLVLPRAATYLAAPIKPGPNTTIRGKGLRFATQVIPLATFSGAALFDIDGAYVTGGYNFYVNLENFLIDCNNVATATLPVVVKMTAAYSCGVDNLYVKDGCGKIIAITTCNDIKLNKPRLFGKGITLATHGIHAVSGCSVTITDPDIEVCGIGILQSADSKVTVLGGYAERNTRAWYASGNTSGNMTVVGGLWQGINSGTIAADVIGANCLVLGGQYVANGGTGLTLNNAASKPVNAQFIGVSGDVSDQYNWATANKNADISGFHKTQIPNYKASVADNVATSIFRIVCPNATANYGYVDVDIYASLSGNRLSQWTGRYRIAFGVSGGAIVATSVTEYAKANINASGNYGLAVTVTAANSIPNLDIQITCNSSGALGEGSAASVMAEATLVQNTDAGAVYIITQ